MRLAILLIISNASLLYAQNAAETNASDDVSQFVGQWSFDIGDGGIMHAGWLNIRQEDGYLDADLMWGAGGIHYGASYVYIRDNTLYIGRNNRSAELSNQSGEIFSRHYPTWIELERNGDSFQGTLVRPRINGSGVDETSITGKKIPDMPDAPSLADIQLGEPVHLIPDPDNLTGWRLIENHLNNDWSVKDGVLQNNPEGNGSGNLRTEGEFEDFQLEFEVNVPPNGNSGVYLRGMHEVQISDSYDRDLNWGGSMGAIFTRITPEAKTEKPAGEWQKMEITYHQRHVTVVLNGTKIVDNQPVDGPTGGAIQSDVTAPGPIYLQGDHTAVSYRNMILTPIIH